MAEYIEREKVLALAVHDPGYLSSIVTAWDIIHIPAVDVVPVVHGRWDSKGLKIRCSACTYRVHLGTADEGVHREEKALFRYCPNCGAKMDLEVSENG